jgi:solute carrier family 25 (mitochondrial citrate transporter), member 1
MTNENVKPNKLLPLAAGCIAGAIEATAVWPMEYIKTQLQLQVKDSKLPYNGMISGLSYTIKTTGFFSLYRGLAPTLIGSMPKAGVRFGLNAQFKDMLKDQNGNISAGSNFLAGLGAGVSEALLIVAPVETIKTKCIELNQSFITGLKHILQIEGIRGVYKGATATALKQGSNQGLRFMWFNEYKRILTRDGEKPLTSIEKFLGGMTAGCFSTLGNNPFDVIKTRMQGTKASQYANTLDCFKQILSKEGFGALYAGVIPRLGRVVPGQGIIFFSFETIQDSLKEFKMFQ